MSHLPDSHLPDSRRVVTGCLAAQAFDEFDVDNSNTLDLDEFREALRTLGVNLLDEQFQDLVAEVDANDSGEIEREEFAIAVEILQAST